MKRPGHGVEVLTVLARLIGKAMGLHVIEDTADVTSLAAAAAAAIDQDLAASHPPR